MADNIEDEFHQEDDDILIIPGHEDSPQRKSLGIQHFISDMVVEVLRERYTNDQFQGLLPFEGMYDQTESLAELQDQYALPPNVSTAQRLRYRNTTESSWHDVVVFREKNCNEVIIFNSNNDRGSVRMNVKQPLKLLYGYGQTMLRCRFSKDYELQHGPWCSYHSICCLIILAAHKNPEHYLMSRDGVWNLIKIAMLQPTRLPKSATDLLSLVATVKHVLPKPAALYAVLLFPLDKVDRPKVENLDGSIPDV